jgi:UDP-glucose 4-epimerase
MKALVTGANGFIGAWALRRLVDAGIRVVALDLAPPGPLVRRLLGNELSDVPWRQADVSASDDMEQACAGCDLTVHLAGVLTPACRDDPVRGAMVNLIGTLKVFEAARRRGIGKVVYASSAAVYGPDHADFPAPTTHYGAFKLACEGSARSYWADHGIVSLGLRPFVVYGPGREVGASAGVSLACRAAAEGAAYTIPFTGRAGMVFIDDVVDAIVIGATTRLDRAALLDLCGEVRSVDEVIDEIRRHHPGAQLSAEGAPLPLCCDTPQPAAAALLPGLRTTPLPDGIARTLAFYR